MGTWKEKSVSLKCDGWIDAQKRHYKILWLLLKMGLFLKSANCERNHKGKYYVVALIKDIIAEVGAHNVVQVIIDNATLCKVAGSLVESQYFYIWTHYVVHTSCSQKYLCH